jgi:hypothetical protein
MMKKLLSTTVLVGVLASAPAWAQFTSGMRAQQVKAAVASELSAKKTADQVAAAALAANVSIADLLAALLAANVSGENAVSAAIKAGYAKQATIDAAVASGLNGALVTAWANNASSATSPLVSGKGSAGNTPKSTSSGGGSSS